VTLEVAEFEPMEMQMITLRSQFLTVIIAAVAFISCGLTPARAATPEDLNRDADVALHSLITSNPAAAAIAKQAKAELIFPNIVKAGFIFGGGYGEGVLKEDSIIDGYYNSISASWGLQIGGQSYGYVVFLMNDNALKYVHETHGWEIGTGPSVVVVNEGVAKNLTTTTLKNDAYAFIFDQQGLMASLSLEGTKVSRIHEP
jgi:lipid-binding SYLF domain-containing protein